ncbi:MAG: endo-1,4-beta-xylanase [Candidatus Hydrogenedentes bacterium]|nr:endo-1,4-beta-xylanase [Candidatus Hydrogenedentota bacterium]
MTSPTALNIAIDQPYRWARETDPEAHLIVNDYAVMATGYPPFFDLLEAAIGRGVPFDGIGIQAHEPRTMRFPLFRVKAHLDKYASFGKALHITEFTPTSSGLAITGSHIEGGWDEAAQADYAVKFYTVCFAHPAVAAITWWDLCDDGSWLEGGGLLRKDLSPKPAYSALLNLIHEDWHTNSAGRTDEEGRFQFRGFYGQYTVEAEHQGKTAKQTIQLRQGSPENFSITLN